MKTICYFCFLLLPVSGFAQFTITGRILNQGDAKPLANASVFLNNTTIGDKSSGDGTFILKSVAPGKYDLVISMLGFETITKTVTVSNAAVKLQDLLLFPRAIALNEVTVKPVTDPDREKNLELFKKEFLGKSKWAEDSEIINPEVLDLAYDKKSGVLTASSDDFLEIKNDALGYNIKYLLTNFKLNRGSVTKFRLDYKGSVLFEEIKGTPSQQERWKKAREEVYQGSVMHFLRSLVNNRLNEEGFKVLRLEVTKNPDRPQDSIIDSRIDFYKKLRSAGNGETDSLSFWLKKAKLPKTFEKLDTTSLHEKDLVKPAKESGLFALSPGKINDQLFITYNKKGHFYYNIQLEYINGANNNETTLVRFIAPYALFDSNGWLAPNSVVFDGNWGVTRVAELLPFDYKPDLQNTRSDLANVKLPTTGVPSPLKDNLLKITAVSDSLSKAFPSEKIYMQFDKPYYALGDTIWFKTYLLDQHLAPSRQSRIINFDIANDSNKVIKQYRVLADSGISRGNITLDKDDFRPGTYTIRAYTNWMRNFKEDNFFYKTFYVVNPGEGSWLINKRVRDTLINGTHSADVKLQFSGLDKNPLMMSEVQLKVMDGSKNLYKQKFRTDQNGVVDVNFSVPQNAGNLAIVAEGIQNNTRAVIPVSLDRITNADVQFLPEGGSLVAGLPASIGFKAIAADGKGCPVSGIVVDHTGAKVAEFQSQHNGMGSFNMAVKAGESYVAKVTLPGGAIKDYPMPGVKSSGTMLKVSNRMGSDSLEIFAAATDDMIQQGNSFYLIGKARGIVCYAAIINLQEGGFRRKIAKSLFPTGIAHFTLMTANHQPLNERLAFIDRHDNLNIRVTADRQAYNPRDSVALKIKVTDNSGNPVAGNFSLAVTDNAQVETDSINDENIISNMLLTSELKGYVEDPGYYVSTRTQDAWQALDNLLLTQGWVGYHWQRVFNPPAIAFQPEKEFLVKGGVFNVFSKPVKGTDVLLFSKTPAMLLDTATDKGGRFVFDRLPQIDTPVFVIKAVNKRGGSFNVGIKMDEIEPPLFARPFLGKISPWNVNSSPAIIDYDKTNAQITQAGDFPAGSKVLKEVTIKAKKMIQGSQNLNGPGNADIVLDEKDMEKAGKKTWLQLLQENIPGFREGNFHSVVHKRTNAGGGLVKDVVVYIDSPWYFIKDKWVRIFVDGYELDSAIDVKNPPNVINAAMINERNFLQSHDAEDIKGIEANLSPKNRVSYELRFGEYSDPVALTYAYIEITTRSGNGPFFGHTPGMYLYKPLPISTAAQFYKPKYGPPNLGKPVPDLRSTVDWEPNITTDANGEAKVSFFTADKPSTYTLIMEGIDGEGGLGYTLQHIDMLNTKDKSR